MDKRPKKNVGTFSPPPARQGSNAKKQRRSSGLRRSTGERVKKMWSTCTREYYASIRQDENPDTDEDTEVLRNNLRPISWQSKDQRKGSQILKAAFFPAAVDTAHRGLLILSDKTMTLYFNRKSLGREAPSSAPLFKFHS